MEFEELSDWVMGCTIEGHRELVHRIIGVGL